MELPPAAPAACPPAADIRPWVAPKESTPPVDVGVDSGPGQLAPAAIAADYRHRLKPTPAGWPIRPHWCVWVEPIVNDGPTGIWEQRWHQAVINALTSWGQLLPITRVSEPAQAQLLVKRQRPPLQNNRASHGRALLELLEVQRQGEWRLEPRVTALISPGQAQMAIQATALHELGHAFGLWGHSDQSGDVMAAKPGAQPVLELSERDRRTLRWLLQQPALSSAASP